MLLAAASFACMGGSIRFLAESGVHPLVTSFFRSALGFFMLSPWIVRAGFDIMRTRKHGLFAARGLVSAVSQAFYFIAISVLPMADAVSLTFTAPLFGTLLAVLILGEVVRMRRAAALLLGFAGVLVVLRPGFSEITWMTATPLLAAVGMAGSWVLVKKLSATEPAERVVFYMVAYTVPFGLAGALLVWEMPEWRHVPWLIAAAAFGNYGQFAMTRAYGSADATAIFPYDFARLPFTAIIAYLLFAQEPMIWTWVGGALIFCSSAYITHREARQRAATRKGPAEGPAGD